jgi:lipopolysaccharide biosynthesis glycosyltransferase
LQEVLIEDILGSVCLLQAKLITVNSRRAVVFEGRFTPDSGATAAVGRNFSYGKIMNTVQAYDDTIHVICAADVNYGPYAGITFSSVIDSNKGERIHLHLFSDGVAQRDIARMEAMARGAGIQFTCYDIKDKLDKLPQLARRINHYTRTTYGRLFFPEFLPATVQKAVYLDCDIICVSSWRDLWTESEGLTLLGAVRDPWADLDQPHKINLGIPPDHAYYNAGVLLINAEAWRQGNVGQRLLEYLSQPRVTKHADQDVLNGTLWNEITELSNKWNVLISSPNPEEVPVYCRTAANLHFCGGFKPWHFGYSAFVKTGAAAFRHAKRTSPWKWKSPDFQVDRIRRKIRQRLDRWQLQK